MSRPDTPVPAPVSAVPRRLRLICAVVAAVVVVVMVVAGLLLRSSGGVVSFRASDQVAMVVLGVILGAGILALGRPRVDADGDGVRVRNILGAHSFSWQVVRAVRFDRSSQWATLLLSNGDEVAVLAVQAIDKERAVRAVEELRALHAAARDPVVPEPPRLYYD